MVWIDPELQVHEAQWTTSGQVPALENHWETLAPTGEPNEYVTAMLNQGTGDWDLFTDGTKRQGQFRIRYRDQADGEWSEEAQARTVQQPAPEPPKPEEEGAWKPFFFASKDAYDDQETYRYGKSGYQLQFMHCGDRSRSIPTRPVSVRTCPVSGRPKTPPMNIPSGVCRGTGALATGIRSA